MQNRSDPFVFSRQKEILDFSEISLWHPFAGVVYLQTRAPSIRLLMYRRIRNASLHIHTKAYSLNTIHLILSALRLWDRFPEQI